MVKNVVGRLIETVDRMGVYANPHGSLDELTIRRDLAVNEESDFALAADIHFIWAFLYKDEDFHFVPLSENEGEQPKDIAAADQATTVLRNILQDYLDSGNNSDIRSLVAAASWNYEAPGAMDLALEIGDYMHERNAEYNMRNSERRTEVDRTIVQGGELTSNSDFNPVRLAKHETNLSGLLEIGRG